jgi:hypothetical protein
MELLQRAATASLQRRSGGSGPACLLAALALALAACSSDFMQARDRAERAYSTPPTDYRGEILAFMRTYLNEPSGVRDAFVTEPALRTFDGINRYFSCVRYNARNTSGRYLGSKESMVFYRDGHLDRVIDDARERCRGAAYVPFPELQRLTR